MSDAAGGGDAREVVLVRHTETAWSRERRHTGRTDLPLTDAGRGAARALAPRLAGLRFALVLRSPLARATETAALAGLSAEPDPDLVEWDYGEYEGLTTAQIRERRPGWLVWRDGCPGGESPADVAARADRVLARIAGALPDGGTACLVGHAHLLRMVGARWLGQPPAFGAHLWLRTGSLSRLGFDREVPVVRAWNT